MKIPTNGQTNLNDLVDQLDSVLEDYELSHNIKVKQRNVEQYLNLSRDEISKLDHNSCMEIAFELSCHSTYIQLIYNKERGRVKWANSVIQTYCCSEWTNYKQFFKDEMKIAAIAKENEAVHKVLKIKNHAEQRVERLNGIANNIKYLSTILVEIAKSKRYVQS